VERGHYPEDNGRLAALAASRTQKIKVGMNWGRFSSRDGPLASEVRVTFGSMHGYSPPMLSKTAISLASASRNLGGQELGLQLIHWKPGSTILDIGCGPGVHLDYFRTKRLIGTGLDRDPDNFRYHGEIEHVQDVSELGQRKFDYVFASHVLEHCPNTHFALKQWLSFLKEDGIMIVFVPPFFNEVSNDHWNIGWNVGQLAMTLVAAGLDCKQSTFYQTSDQVFGFGVKRKTSGSFLIEDTLPFLPPAFSQGLYNGPDYQNLRADIAFVAGEQIEYLPRRRAQLAIPMPDPTWLSAEAGSNVIAPPENSILKGVCYSLAAQATEPGYLRVAFCHDALKEHAELWFAVVPGLNIRQFECVELTAGTQGFDPLRTDQIAIGGQVGFSGAALFCEMERIV